jgi:hypothetical protein
MMGREVREMVPEGGGVYWKGVVGKERGNEK